MIRRTAVNELFPSADWRYLLPCVSPGVVVAVGDGWAPATAMRLWEQCRAVDPTGIGPHDIVAASADLVVAGSTDPGTLRTVRRLLGPEAIAYVEVDWPRATPALTMRRRLARAGLEVGPMYSIAIGPDRWAPSWWTTIGGRSAARFTAATRRPVGTRFSPARWLSVLPATIARRWPAVAAAHPPLTHPRRHHRMGVIVTRRDETGRRAGHGDSLMPALRPDNGRHPTELAMRVGGSSTDQPILFYFDEGDEPYGVIKAPTLSEEVLSSRHESSVLSRLGQSTLVCGVPDPLSVTGVDGFDAWGQSFAAGTALERLASPERLVDDGAAMTNWTIALARATRSTMPVDTVKSLRKAVEKVAIGLSDLADGQQLAQAVLASFDRLNPTAAVRCHGDLGPWNIHVDKGGRPTVIDWADSVEAGLPMSDLIHFIAHLSLQAYDAYGRDRRSHVVSELMDPAATCGRLMIKQTGVYAGGLGMDSGRIDDYRLVTWALDLHDRPSSKWETDVYLELLRAEVRRITSNP